MVAIKVDPVKGLRSLNLKLIASGTNKNVWGLNYKDGGIKTQIHILIT